jgi:hypothetical protein
VAVRGRGRWRRRVSSLAAGRVTTGRRLTRWQTQQTRCLGRYHGKRSLVTVRHGRVIVKFEEWFGEELPQLLRFATVLCGSSDLAQDLVQDVAIKVQQRWLKLSQLDYRDAYVRRMLVNEHLSFRRKFARIFVRATVEPPPVATIGRTSPISMPIASRCSMS